jgi:hypothetical protein
MSKPQRENNNNNSQTSKPNSQTGKQTARNNEAKKELKCGICSDKFHDPKLLSCLHSFCSNCLRRYVEKGKYKTKFPCPLCTRSIDLPKNGGVRVRFISVYYHMRYYINQYRRKTNFSRFQYVARSTFSHMTLKSKDFPENVCNYG